MWIAVALLCCSALAALPRAGGSCPSQCSCSFHSLSEGTKARYAGRSAGPPRSQRGRGVFLLLWKDARRRKYCVWALWPLFFQLLCALAIFAED